MSIYKNEKANPNLITSYLEKNTTPISKKRSSSILSPVESIHQNKKANTGECNMEDASEVKMPTDTIADVKSDNLKCLLIPLMEKVDKLRETVDTKYERLESTITTQKKRFPRIA